MTTRCRWRHSAVLDSTIANVAIPTIAGTRVLPAVKLSPLSRRTLSRFLNRLAGENVLAKSNVHVVDGRLYRGLPGLWRIQQSNMPIFFRGAGRGRPAVDSARKSLLLLNNYPPAKRPLRWRPGSTSLSRRFASDSGGPYISDTTTVMDFLHQRADWHAVVLRCYTRCADVNAYRTATY